MSRFTAEFTMAAARELRELDPQIRRRVVTGLVRSENDPRPAGAKRLAGFADTWRTRVGDIRILYEVSDDRVVVTVFRIAHRREVYNDL